jgi:hypothetical protein
MGACTAVGVCMLILQVAKAKASKSTTGRAISAVSFNRKQFGARKKIEYANGRLLLLCTRPAYYYR